MRTRLTGSIALSLTSLIAVAASAGAAERATHIGDADIETASALRERALRDDSGYRFTEGLTTEIGPRLAGGSNDAKAREWVIAHFKALGFDKVWTEPVTYPKWVRRSERAEIVAPFPQPLVLTALGHSPGTPAAGITADVVAFDSFDALKGADAASVRGKIVYVGARMHAKKDGADYGIGSHIRTAGPSLASSKGALAFLLRSAGTDSNRLPHTGVTAFDEGVKPIPAAALSSPDADQIERILKIGTPLTIHLMLDCGFEGDFTGANVIAELRGSERPDEYFLMGGHLDSWDPGTGAIDDAAGIGISVGAAHVIAELPKRPKRSIRVVAFANEEAGLYGGKALAGKNRAIGNAVLGSESDEGADRIYKITASVKPSARDAIGQIAEALKPLGIDYDASAPGNGGSDLSAVHAVGMAAVSLHQDSTRYFDWHHTANDTFDKIDPAQMRQNVAAYAVTAFLAAQADGDFGSAPGAFANDEGD